jgi:hypothetical protein
MCFKLFTAMSSPDIFVGSVIGRQSAFAFEKFLQNQREIQIKYPCTALVIATDESDFINDLEKKLAQYGIKGNIINYVTEKPVYAKDRIWSITYGRNAVRNYFLTKTEADYLLYIDSDMTCDPDVITIMKDQIGYGYDVVVSGYRLRHFGIGLVGCLGCAIMTREILRKIPFRCIEYKNHEVIDEGVLFEMDLLTHHAKVKKGLFLKINHYIDKENFYSIEPGKISMFKKITTNIFLRYMLTKISIILHFDIAGRLHAILESPDNK